MILTREDANHYAIAHMQVAIYIIDLIFVDHCSTVKTAKIGSLENFQLYGNNIMIMYSQVNMMFIHDWTSTQSRFSYYYYPAMKKGSIFIVQI